MRSFVKNNTASKRLCGNHYALILFLLLMLSLLLTACVGNQFEQPEADKVKVEGQKKMTEWLSNNIPGSKLISAENYLDSYPSGPRYLTDYVFGQYSTGKTTVDYAINVATEKVYIDPPEGSEAYVEAFLREALHLPEDVVISDLSYSMQLPASTERTGKNKGHEYYNMQLIPYEVTDPAQYFMGDREETIEVSCSVYCPSLDPLEITLQDVIQLRQTEKVYFFQLSLRNDNHDSISIHGNTCSSSGAAYQDYQDFMVYTDTYYKYEKYNESSDTYEVETDLVFDMDNDIQFQETDDGYLITYLNNEVMHQFRIIAKDGAKIAEHDYKVIIGKEEDSDTLYDEYDAHWELRDDGYTYLIREDGYYVEIYQYTQLIIR